MTERAAGSLHQAGVSRTELMTRRSLAGREVRWRQPGAAPTDREGRRQAWINPSPVFPSGTRKAGGCPVSMVDWSKLISVRHEAGTPSALAFTLSPCRTTPTPRLLRPGEGYTCTNTHSPRIYGGTSNVSNYPCCARQTGADRAVTGAVEENSGNPAGVEVHRLATQDTRRSTLLLYGSRGSILFTIS